MGKGMPLLKTTAINTDDFLNTLDQWLPLFSVVFIALLLYVMFRMLAVMPKTKPQEIRASKRSGVTWDEIAGALDAGDPDGLVFEAPEVLARVERHGDLYADNLTRAQPLPALDGR